MDLTARIPAVLRIVLTLAAGWLLAAPGANAAPVFSVRDAGESGAFNFGSASATLGSGTDSSAGELPLALEYSVGRDSGAGLWTKSYPADLGPGTADAIRITVQLPEDRQQSQIAVKAEVKGTRDIQTIPVPLASQSNAVEANLDWSRIGTLNEVVLVVTRAGGPDPVEGSLLADISFRRQTALQKAASSASARAGAAMVLAGLLGLIARILAAALPGRPRRGEPATGFRRDLSLGMATVLVLGLAWSIYSLPEAAATATGMVWRLLAIALAGAATAEVLKFGLTGRHLSPAEAALNALVTGVLAASASPIPILQAPGSMAGVLELSAFTSALFATLFHAVNAWTLAGKHRHLSAIGGGIILAVPYLFSFLLLLASDAAPGPVRSVLIVFLFNEAVALAIALATKRSLVRGIRTHLLFLFAAIAVIVAPGIAALGSGATVAAWSAPLRFPVTILTTIFSQAGIWMEAYLLTGMLMDAIHSKAPSRASVAGHLSSGVRKGMVYSGVFMAILFGLHYFILSSPGQWLFSHVPQLIAAAFGAVAFPLFKTIIESFDGSTAFFQRVRNSYRNPWHYLRGAVIGAGAAWAVASGIFDAPTGRRAFLGLLIGIAASAGVGLVRDGFDQSKKRGRVRSWRAYLVDACMGGFIGAALGFYLDAAQVDVVVKKFHQYVSAGTRPLGYETIPFLNRWGYLNLGEYTGGVSLLFKEALAGVINWSIAAWMFAINRTFLSAALDRNTAPIKFLFTREGFIQLIQHMIEVMRWGLWMSPIIFSFLRMMGEPTWYNQDGAIRTLFAIVNNLAMSPEGFVQWSLGVFVALLAYDLVRILIWIDHMGLRVATLVNFSFLGMDKLDGWVARFIGRDATARYIPEGVKRFTTWAPLLIPFYIPMGANWDYVWDKSAEVRAQSAGGLLGWLGSLPPSGLLLVTVAAVPVATGLYAGARWLRSRKKKDTGKGLKLANRACEIVLNENGECFSRLPAKGYDITRRAYDHREPCGRALFLVDGDGDTAWPVMGNYPADLHEPSRHEEFDSSLRITNTAHGLNATVSITLPDDDEAVEIWEVTVENPGDASRDLKIAPYVEWVINNPGGDRGHTQYNRLFPEISYASDSNALLALHRYTKLHGILASDAAPEGYLTSRIDFIGRAQSLWSPRALETLAFLEPRDSEAFPTFDPISSLLVPVSVAAKGTATVRFLVGCTAKRAKAKSLVARHLAPGTAPAAPDPALTPRRPLIGHGEIPPGTPQPYFEYEDGGNTLRILTPFTPRPWDHSMSNALGHVLCVTNRGLHTTSSGNSQQNRVTPDWADTVTREMPGEALYLFDTDEERWYSPTYQPLNDPEASYDTGFSVDGTATFRMTRDTLATDLTVFVPQDDPVGLYLLTVKNSGNATRRLRFAPCFQIVLADMPENAGPLVIHRDESTDALYFQNPRNTFRPGVAFAAMTAPARRVETRRGRFFGAANAAARPDLVRTGSPADDAGDRAPIAGFLAELEVPAHGEVTVAVMLGQADDRGRAEAVVEKFRDLDAVRAELPRTRQWWLDLVKTCRIETSDDDFDQLQNWLKYQALAERIWARRGFYQASGAFGFRDQLQDSVNMIWVDPALARNQIQLHAAQQFLEGDVVHWFFRLQDGRTGFACRSHAYDNLLWLGWATVEYVRMTGDKSLLDIPVPYLQAEQPLQPLPEGKHGMGFFPHRSPISEPIYRHCLRAFDLVFEQRLGPHGLPLIGAGDWNDGLDEIGSEGRGESTWLGFFLHYILRDFIPHIEEREGSAKAGLYRERMTALREALEGTWREDRYLRAIHDDGTEIGIKGSGVWEIDALTASWSVMSGVNPERARICFDTAIGELEREKVVLLGHPALREDTKPYLGRSSRYPEGVRENGMYCHGDQWLVKAARLLAEQAMREGDRDAASTYRETGYRIWRKISPLFHVTADEIETYGGQPNKQAADILTTFDPGRMIWNGYTGAAGWMLRQAFEGILGYQLVGGEIVAPDDLEEPRGELRATGASRDIRNSPLGKR